ELPCADRQVAATAQPEITVDFESLDFYKGEGYPITLGPGESVAGPGNYMMPGTYTVTVRGENLNNSYIHSYYRQRLPDPVTNIEIVFLDTGPEAISFRMVVYDSMTNWEVAIHSLGDQTVTVNSVTVRRDG
ncbi:MAG: hypothetical protein ACI4OL_09685, partial [Gemmiger sp.]